MWEQIRDNQVRSVILVTALGFMLILLGSFLGQTVLGDWSVGLLLALLIWIVMTLVGYFQGDSILLSISNARKIGPDDMPRIYNVVEEMKIASGFEKMPDIYIIDDPALNAFATGRDKKQLPPGCCKSSTAMSSRGLSGMRWRISGTVTCC
jgi:heat shock protein HtpX